MDTLKDRFIRTLAPFIVGGLAEDSFERPLRDLGVDSVKLIELIGCLEKSCGVRFSDEDITPENFRTPRALLDLVVRRSDRAE